MRSWQAVCSLLYLSLYLGLALGLLFAGSGCATAPVVAKSQPRSCYDVYVEKQWIGKRCHPTPVACESARAADPHHTTACFQFQVEKRFCAGHAGCFETQSLCRAIRDQSPERQRLPGCHPTYDWMGDIHDLPPDVAWQFCRPRPQVDPCGCRHNLGCACPALPPPPHDCFVLATEADCVAASHGLVCERVLGSPIWPP